MRYRTLLSQQGNLAELCESCGDVGSLVEGLGKRVERRIPGRLKPYGSKILPLPKRNSAPSYHAVCHGANKKGTSSWGDNEEQANISGESEDGSPGCGADFSIVARRSFSAGLGTERGESRSAATAVAPAPDGASADADQRLRASLDWYGKGKTFN
jgi:hypothetical protein